MRRIFNDKVLFVVIIGLIIRPEWADAIHKYVLLGFNQLLLGLTQLKGGFVQWQDEHMDEFIHNLRTFGEFIMNNTDLSWVITHPVLSLAIATAVIIIIRLTKRYIDPIVMAWVKAQVAKIESKMPKKDNNQPYVIKNLTAQQQKTPLALTTAQD
jgi:hypothetical protein